MLTRGLIIAELWITKILSGEKTWEIRGTSTKVRERIGLIRKGSGQIVGTARLVGVVGPLSAEALRVSVDKHQIPPEQIDAVVGRYAKPHAWVLEDVQRLEPPRPYRHPSGAVIWVTLAEPTELLT